MSLGEGMDTSEFLGYVWPAHGKYCIATPTESKGYSHYVLDTIEKAAHVASTLDKTGKTVYFAVASLKQERIWDDKKNGGQGGWRVRTKENIDQIKSVFIDIDVGAGALKYSSQTDAIKGIASFCKTIDWPLPALVSSGIGIHAYWPLLTAVDGTTYEKISRLLLGVSRHIGFRLDSAAMDITRTLRPVGTYHRKGDPIQVRLLKQVPHYDVRTLVTALVKFQKEQSVQVKQPPLNNPFGNNIRVNDSEPLDVELLLRCGAIKELKEQQGAIGYKHWLHCLQVLRFANNGRAIAHEWSSGANNYNADELDRLYDDLTEKEIGPTLCETFSLETKACETCPHNGKINTPATLGRIKQKLIEQPFTLVNANSTPIKVYQGLPPPPAPYQRKEKIGIFKQITDKEGEPLLIQICSNDLMPLGRLFNEREQKEYSRWRTETPSDGTLELQIASSSLYDKRLFAAAMADLGIYLVPEMIDEVRSYMSAYLRKLQQNQRRAELFSRLGWRDNDRQFVLGNSVYTATGQSNCEIERNNRAADAIRSAGSLDRWKQIINMFSENEAFLPHQFCIGVAFGAPLMKFTGQAGGIINMLGKSGEGKSTIQKLVNSVWGHPRDLMLPAEASSSTHNAKIGYICLLNNLPVCAEEITNVSPNEISSLAYAINTGEEKLRMSKDGGMRTARGGWNTIMLSSSNTSLHEKLISTEGAAATTLRIFEIRLPLVRQYTKTEFFTQFEGPIQTNFGLAGHAYAQYLSNNPAKIRAIVEAVMADLDASSQAGSEERVWLAVCAATMAGLAIAKKIGLHTFDLNKIKAYILSQVALMRVQTRDMYSPPVEALATFVAAMQRRMLVVEACSISGVNSKDVVVALKPFDGLDIRYETHTNRLFISNRALRNWCLENGYIFNDMLEELKLEGIVTRTNQLKTLGGGTPYSAGQVRCVVVNTALPQFSGGQLLTMVTNNDKKDETKLNKSND